MSKTPDYTSLKERAKKQLSNIENITGVGIGLKIKDGEPVAETAIIISVLKKKPLAELETDQIIPETIDGVQTDVFECGYSQPTTNGLPDESTYRPLKGGCAIRIRRSLAETARGTLGCFARTTRDPVGMIVLLTNQHFFDGPSVSEPSCWGCTSGSNVGQPNLDAGNVIANFHRAVLDDTVDAGIAELKAGIEYSPEIIDLVDDVGPISGTAAVTQDDLLDLTMNPPPNNKYKVFKRGATTGVTNGWLVSVDFDPHPPPDAPPQPGRPVIRNQLLILPLPPTVSFSEGGDSGSVIVNEDGKVMGLHSNAATDPGTGTMTAGFASPIEDIMSKLHIEIITASTAGEVSIVAHAEAASTEETPVPAGGGVAISLGEEEHHRLQVQVRSDLESSSLGRDILAFWRQHRYELNSLINSNKRVATVWHRSGCAAIFQTLLRAQFSPQVIVPKVINGKPVNECIERFVQILLKYGSHHLTADIRHYEMMLPDIGGKSYPQLLQLLGD